MLEKIAERAQSLPVWVRFFFIAIPIGFVIYEAYTYSGIWRFISELQMGENGNEYYPVLSGGVSFIVAAIPMIVVQQLLIATGLFSKKSEDN